MVTRRSSVLFLASLRILGVAAECKITEYGAIGDGVTLNTKHIQRVIDDPKCDEVYVPVGVFLTGALNLTSHMTLRVDGVLRGSERPEDYPIVPALESYGTCRDTGFPAENAYGRHQALISGWNLRNVTLQGAGVIDGNGGAWWARNLAGTLDFGRPRLIEPMYCKEFRVYNLNLKDSAFWTVHPYACNDVHIADVVITAPRNERAPNTDGIDPDSSSDVLVERVYVDTGDNAVAIKSGIDRWGRKFATPARNILIRDSYFVSASVAIGSEMSGGIHNVTFDRCVFGDPFARVWKQGFMIKSSLGRGGVVRDVTVKNSIFHSGDRDPSGVTAMPPISINMFYAGGGQYSKEQIDRDPSLVPTIRDVKFENIIAEGSGTKALTGEFLGLVYSPIANVRIRNFTVLGKSKGWLCSAATKMDTDTSVVPPAMPSDCPFFPPQQAKPSRVVMTIGKDVDCAKSEFGGPMEAWQAGCSPANMKFREPHDPGFLFGSEEAQHGATRANLPKLPFGLALVMRHQRMGHNSADGSGGGERGTIVAVGGDAANHPMQPAQAAVTWDEMKIVCVMLGVLMVLPMSLLTWWLKRKFRRVKQYMSAQLPLPTSRKEELTASRDQATACPSTPQGISTGSYEPPIFFHRPPAWSKLSPHRLGGPHKLGGFHKSPSLPSDMSLTQTLLEAEEGGVCNS